MGAEASHCFHAQLLGGGHWGRLSTQPAHAPCWESPPRVDSGPRSALVGQNIPRLGSRLGAARPQPRLAGGGGVTPGQAPHHWLVL